MSYKYTCVYRQTYHNGTIHITAFPYSCLIRRLNSFPARSQLTSCLPYQFSGAHATVTSHLHSSFIVGLHSTDSSFPYLQLYPDVVDLIGVASGVFILPNPRPTDLLKRILVDRLCLLSALSSFCGFTPRNCIPRIEPFCSSHNHGTLNMDFTWLDARLEDGLKYPYTLSERIPKKLSDIHGRNIYSLLASLSCFGHRIMLNQYSSDT